MASCDSAATSGVIGSRCGTTRPTAGVGVGLDDRDRTGRVSVKPQVSASFAGMMHDHLPVRTCENSTIIEFDSSVGDGSARRRAEAGR